MSSGLRSRKSYSSLNTHICFITWQDHAFMQQLLVRVLLMTYRNYILITLNIILLCATIISLSYYAKSRRVISKNVIVECVPSMSAAYDEWLKMEYHGRTLLYCDRYLNVNAPTPYSKQLTNSISDNSYIYSAMQSNVVRKIYHVIPDASWPEVERNLLEYPTVTKSGGVYHMAIFDGCPLYIVSASKIPKIKEIMLMQVNSDIWNDTEFNALLDTLRGKALRFDYISVCGEYAKERSARLISHD